jgi:hypothetical protein
MSRREAFLMSTMPRYSFFKEVSRRLLSSDKVFIVGDILGYYLDVPYQWGDPLNQGVINYDSFDRGEQLAAALKAQNITHIYCNRSVPGYFDNPRYYTPHTLAIIEDLLAHHAKLILTEGPCNLFRLL